MAPESMPPVFPRAPAWVMPSTSSGRSLPPWACRSRRFVASAKRRNVSTLAMTMRASIVRISMPTSDTRTKTSITSPLSRIRATTSASEADDGRST